MNADIQRVYLAGPDIYHAGALEIAANKKALCDRYGLEGVSSLDMAGGRLFEGGGDTASAITQSCIDLIRSCDAIVANMSPFRGPGMDPGTALEMGVMLGLDRPVAGYSLDQSSYADRLFRLHEVFEKPLASEEGHLRAPDGLLVEDFGLTDCAIVTGAVLKNGTPVTEDFESALRWVRRILKES